jgi:hypothetical protein
MKPLLVVSTGVGIVFLFTLGSCTKQSNTPFYTIPPVTNTILTNAQNYADTANPRPFVCYTDGTTLFFEYFIDQGLPADTSSYQKKYADPEASSAWFSVFGVKNYSIYAFSGVKLAIVHDFVDNPTGSLTFTYLGYNPLFQ